MMEIAMNNRALEMGVRQKLEAYLASSPTVQEKVKKASQQEPGKETKIDVTEEVQALVDKIMKNPGMIRDWPGVSQAEQEIRSRSRGIGTSYRELQPI